MALRRPRSSRQRYWDFREQYRQRRLDEAADAERGTHDELMSARGVYHAMVLRQMESHGETVDAAWSTRR